MKGRWQDGQGKWHIESLKDLKKGDKVYCTFHGDRFVPTVVTRVRTVECATIITVEKREGIMCKRFVGYYTGSLATSDDRGVLKLHNYYAEWAEKAISEAEERSEVIAKRADALRALRVLKIWLNQPEREFQDRKVE